MSVGRNDPCPCGSGRKYKQCCLRRDEEEAARRRHRWEGVALAMSWLGERYPAEQDAAVHEGFMVALDDEEVDAISDLPGGAREMLELNVGEWLLAEGRLELGPEGARVEHRAAELVLGPDGPALTPPQRQVVEALRDHPLRLYEVAAVEPGRGLTLRDALDPDAPPRTLEEPVLSKALEPGERVGLRLVPDGEAWETSGALYAFSAEAGAEVIDRVRRQEADPDVPGQVVTGALRQEYLTDAIIDLWLFGMVGAGEADAEDDGAAAEGEDEAPRG